MSTAFEEIKAGLVEVLRYHRGYKTNVRETTYIVENGRAKIVSNTENKSNPVEDSR